MGDTSRSETVSSKLQRIAKQALEYPQSVFTTLMHEVDVEFLREAFCRTRKSAAAGADGVTAQEYGRDLDRNLEALHERMRAGRYEAPPVKRVWLDKEDGTKRPIGIPEFEDKLAQRAVAMLLGAVYETEFHGFSYGFRPGRSAHQALRDLRARCLERNTGWIIDADVSKFFDSVDHGQLREVLRRRVNDGGVLRYIGKWLNAGVQEAGVVTYPEDGTPQGGVISPMLANIFLHHVLDEWFEREIQPWLHGQSFLIRFADDFVIGCEREDDARRVMAVLPKRFARFRLTIHPEKTALVPFGRPRPSNGQGAGNGTFTFLGFTHYWAKSRRGFWAIKRKTAAKRLRRTLKAIWQWCRTNRHDRVTDQWRTLKQKLLGHYQYYAVRCNYDALNSVYRQACETWRYWLGRRSSRSYVNWAKMARLLTAFPLPAPRILHNDI
jgi:RNA-directed DNA polymerase